MSPDVLVSCGAPFDARGGMAASYANIGSLLSERGYSVVTRFGPSCSGRRGWFVRQTEYARAASAVFNLKPRVAIVSSADSALASAVPHPQTRLVAMSNGLEHLARMSADEHGYGQHHFRWGHRHVREPLLRLAFRRAEAAVVLSQRQRDFVISQWGLTPQAVHVLPQSVEDIFHSVSTSDRIPSRILWIGQWAEFKGLDRLVRIAHSVLRSSPNATMVLAGTRTDESTARAAFSADVQHQLRVLPLVSREEMAELVATAHVGLVTSYFEGFGKMILEMMAGGLPLVSSRVAAAEDYIVSGVSGFLYDTESEAVERLSTVLAHDFEKQVGKAARAAVGGCRRTAVGDGWAGIVAPLLES